MTSSDTPIRAAGSQDRSFLAPRLVPSNVGRYIVRSAILREVKAVSSALHGTLVDVGCGQMPYKEMLLAPPSRVRKYIGLDLQTTRYGSVQPDLVWDGKTIPLEDESVDCVLLTEVLEHCPEPRIVLAEVYRVLRRPGLVFMTVPFLWPLHEVPFDEVRYTPFCLRRHFEQAGFRSVELRALGGWDASLAQMIGLWAARRPLARWKRMIATCVATPIIRLLLTFDKRPDEFKESTMLTGLVGTANKLL